MEQLVKELLEANVGRVLVNEPLARYTTMKIGGPADILIVPKHVAGIEKTLELVKKYKQGGLQLVVVQIFSYLIKV